MPTYSYECRKCGDVFDIFHRMTESPRVKCGTCGGGARKLIGTGAGIIFKGSGFYETDFKTKKGTPPTESKSENGSSASGEGANKTKAPEAKPAETKAASGKKAAAANN